MIKLRRLRAAVMAFALIFSLFGSNALARPERTPTNSLKNPGENGYAATSTTITPTTNSGVFKIEQTITGYVEPETIAVVMVLDNSGSMGNPSSSLTTDAGVHPVYSANLLPSEYLVDPAYRAFFPTTQSFQDPVSGSVYTGTGNNTNWTGGGYRWEWAIRAAQDATETLLAETTYNTKARMTAVAYVAFGYNGTPTFVEDFHCSNNSVMNLSMGRTYRFAGDYDSTANGAYQFLRSKIRSRTDSGANIEAGMLEAYNLLSGIDADRKFILYLGDGEANNGNQEELMNIAAAIKAPKGGSSIDGRTPLGADIFAINLGSAYNFADNRDNNTSQGSWLKGTWLRDGIYGQNGDSAFGGEQTIIALSAVLANAYYSEGANFASGALNRNAASIQNNINFQETGKRYTYVRQSDGLSRSAQKTRDVFDTYAQSIQQANTGLRVTSILSNYFSIVQYTGSSMFSLSTTNTASNAHAGSVSRDGDQIIWDIDNIPNGDTLTLTYYVQINPASMQSNTYYPVLNDSYVYYSAAGMSCCINFPLPYATLEDAVKVEANSNDAEFGSGRDVGSAQNTEELETLYSPRTRPINTPDFSFDIDYSDLGLEPGATPPPPLETRDVSALTESENDDDDADDFDDTSDDYYDDTDEEETDTPDPTVNIDPENVNQSVLEGIIPVTDGVVLFSASIIIVAVAFAIIVQYKKRNRNK